MNDLIQNLKNNKMEIVLDESALEFLTDKGYDPKFGARPLKRAIQNYIEDPLAEELLLGKLKDGDKIITKRLRDKDELFFEIETRKEKKAQEPEHETDSLDSDKEDNH